MQLKRILNKKGGALISALFITALAAIIATALAMRGRLIIHEGELVKAADQSYLNLQNVQYWAADQVEKYLSQWTALRGQNPAALRNMKWTFREKTSDNKLVTGKLFDAQGRYNLNNLVYSANAPHFAALILAVDKDITEKEAMSIAQSCTDWMTKGALDTAYASENPPYRASRHQMVDVTELRLIAGMTHSLYEKLKPYIVVLPIKVKKVSTSNAEAPSGSAGSGGSGQVTSVAQQTPIDINSASWPVFLAVNPKLTVVQAESLESCRIRHHYFTSVSAFMSACVNNGISLNQSALVSHSSYYLLESESIGNGVDIHLNSLLVSMINKRNKLEIKVVWQAFY